MDRRGAADDEVRRNAGAVLDRLPVGALVARDGQALYANRTLLELIGYRDFAEFQSANALSRMFHGHDPQADDDWATIGAVAIVRADGQILSVDGHAQVIGWDGAPSTLDRAAPLAGSRTPCENARRRERSGDSQRLGEQRPSEPCSTGQATRSPSRSIWPAASCR